MHNDDMICAVIERESVTGKQTRGRINFARAVLSWGYFCRGRLMQNRSILRCSS